MLAANDDESGRGGIPHYQLAAGHRDPAWYRAGYDGEVRYVDEEIGRLLAAYAARVPARDAVVVVTADHGEGLGENDYWFAHGEFLNDALVHVPLLMRVPGEPPGVRSGVVSLVDVAPTLLAAVGVATPAPDRPTTRPSRTSRPCTSRRCRASVSPRATSVSS